MDTRRLSDHDQTIEIEKLIAEESDPRVRVQLMLMHKLTGSVATIGATVAELDTKFAAHSRGEEAVLNQIKGGWKVAAWIFGIAQVAIGYAYIDLHDSLDKLAEQQQVDVVAHERLDGRIKVIESQKGIRK